MLCRICHRRVLIGETHKGNLARLSEHFFQIQERMSRNFTEYNLCSPLHEQLSTIPKRQLMMLHRKYDKEVPKKEEYSISIEI